MTLLAHWRMMMDPDLWPMVSVLPLRRDVEGSFPELGFLVRGRGPTVFYGSMDDAPNAAQGFPTFDALLRAGWRVD